MDDAIIEKLVCSLTEELRESAATGNEDIDRRNQADACIHALKLIDVLIQIESPDLAENTSDCARADRLPDAC